MTRGTQDLDTQEDPERDGLESGEEEEGEEINFGRGRTGVSRSRLRLLDLEISTVPSPGRQGGSCIVMDLSYVQTGANDMGEINGQKHIHVLLIPSEKFSKPDRWSRETFLHHHIALDDEIPIQVTLQPPPSIAGLSDLSLTFPSLDALRLWEACPQREDRDGFLQAVCQHAFHHLSIHVDQFNLKRVHTTSFHVNSEGRFKVLDWVPPQVMWRFLLCLLPQKLLP
ncbi:hypothetical protein BJ684DRAFT_14334 [Piptocephalis cylindrospora]|uniref:Uncharacterized protein n=1 Tax=Piptocephalis cylindrospora TaxID=1907219 RepID=A0A4P9Y994_9FUNG|nr:hypothetical protein BJ684DRAFT_14334 [Piptocephalis cylindrospora]|eukprot:RKP15404.1 hypothetical protein BJ684DRAFT_14334 [Piptocephalis cylindrospora]